VGGCTVEGRCSPLGGQGGIPGVCWGIVEVHPIAPQEEVHVLTHHYDYKSTLTDSLKVNWRVEDLIGGDKKLNFTKPFLPDTLAGAGGITCLSAAERLKLNQIRGNSYLYMFGLVEEFILPFILDHVRKGVHGNEHAMRALLTFADEEGKHIHLFRCFAEAFSQGFGTPCAAIGPAEQIAGAVLAHRPLGVALATLHLEWLTQRHYLDSVKTSEELDPLFSSLLRHHWMEEAQHAKLDTLLIGELAEKLSPAEIDAAVGDFLAIGTLLDGGMATQVQLDLESLSKATGRTFTEEEKKEIVTAQTKNYRWSFLVSGMTHPNFIRTLEQLTPGGAAKVAEVAKALS
jgi:hypothetical protein